MTHPALIRIQGGNPEEEQQEDVHPALRRLQSSQSEDLRINTARGRRIIEAEQRAARVEELKRILAKPNITPEQRARVERMLETEDVNWTRPKYDQDRPTIANPISNPFAFARSNIGRGIGAGLVQGLTGFADLVGAGINLIENPIGRGLRNTAQEASAIADEFFDPQGAGGLGGQIAGSIVSGATPYTIVTRATGRAMLGAIGSLGSKGPAVARLEQVLRAAETGTIGQRVAGQAAMSIPIDVFEAAMMEDATLQQRLTQFGISTGANVVGAAVLPAAKTPPRGFEPAPVEIDPKKAQAIPGDRSQETVAKVDELVRRGEEQKALRKMQREARIEWEKANPERKWKSLTNEEKEAVYNIHQRGMVAALVPDYEVDPVTGIGNQKSFLEAAKAIPEGHVIIYGDANGLKDFNDRLGQSAGDHLLSHLGTAASETLSELGVNPSWAFRAGGDEIAIIVPKDLAPQARDLFESKSMLEMTEQQGRRTVKGNLSAEIFESLDAANSKQGKDLLKARKTADKARHGMPGRDAAEQAEIDRLVKEQAMREVGQGDLFAAGEPGSAGVETALRGGEEAGAGVDAAALRVKRARLAELESKQRTPEEQAEYDSLYQEVANDTEALLDTDPVGAVPVVHAELVMDAQGGAYIRAQNPRGIYTVNLPQGIKPDAARRRLAQEIDKIKKEYPGIEVREGPPSDSYSGLPGQTAQPEVLRAAEQSERVERIIELADQTERAVPKTRRLKEAEAEARGEGGWDVPVHLAEVDGTEVLLARFAPQGQSTLEWHYKLPGEDWTWVGGNKDEALRDAMRALEGRVSDPNLDTLTRRIADMSEEEAARWYQEQLDAGRTEEDIDAEILREIGGDDLVELTRVVDGKVGGQFDKSLFKKLGATLYEQGLGLVVTKETIQNAVDSIKAKGVVGRIDITYQKRGDRLSFTIADSGVGMSPEVAAKEFLDVGGSFKEAENASGGFGIAKVGIFSNAERVDMETIWQSPDGRLLRTEINGSADDWINGTMDYFTSEATSGMETGTRLTVEFNPETSAGIFTWDIDQFVQSVVNYSNLPEVEIWVNGQEMIPVPEAGIDIDATSDLDLPSAKLEIIPSASKVGTGTFPSTKIVYLNNGLYQISDGFMSSPDHPAFVIVDVQPKVNVEDPNYPFTLSREGIRKEVKDNVQKVIQSITSNVRQGQADELFRAFDEAPTIEGTPFKVVDTSTELDPRLVRDLSRRGYTKLLIGEIDKYLSNIIKPLWRRRNLIDPKFIPDPDQISNFEFVGMGVGSGYLGINVDRKGIRDILTEAGAVMPDGWKDSRAILVNPYVMFKEVQGMIERRATPDQPPLRSHREMAEIMAEHTLGTMWHELLHNVARGHDEAFAGALTRAFGPVLRESAESLDDLVRAWEMVISDPAFEIDLDAVTVQHSSRRNITNVGQRTGNLEGLSRSSNEAPSVVDRLAARSGDDSEGAPGTPVSRVRRDGSREGSPSSELSGADGIEEAIRELKGQLSGKSPAEKRGIFRRIAELNAQRTAAGSGARVDYTSGEPGGYGGYATVMASGEPNSALNTLRVTSDQGAATRFMGQGERLDRVLVDVKKPFVYTGANVQQLADIAWKADPRLRQDFNNKFSDYLEHVQETATLHDLTPEQKQWLQQQGYDAVMVPEHLGDPSYMLVVDPAQAMRAGIDDGGITADAPRDPQQHLTNNLLDTVNDRPPVRVPPGVEQNVRELNDLVGRLGSRNPNGSPRTPNPPATEIPPAQPSQAAGASVGRPPSSPTQPATRGAEGAPPKDDWLTQPDELINADHDKPLSEMTLAELDELKEEIFLLAESIPEGTPMPRSVLTDIERLRRATLNHKTEGVLAAKDAPIDPPAPKRQVLGETPRPVVEPTVKPGDQIDPNVIRKLYAKPTKQLTLDEALMLASDLDNRITSTDILTATEMKKKLDAVRDRIIELRDPPRNDGVILYAAPEVTSSLAGFMLGLGVGDTHEERVRNSIIGGMLGLGAGRTVRKFYVNRTKTTPPQIPGQKEIRDKVKTIAEIEGLDVGDSFLNKLERAYQAVGRPSYAIEKATALAGAKKLPAHLNPGKLAASFGRWVSQAEQFIFGRPFLTDATGMPVPMEGVMSAQEIAQMVDMDTQTLGEVMAAMTTLEQLAIKGRTSSNINPEAAAEFLRHVPEHFHRAAKEARKLHLAMLDVLVDAGVISAEGRARMGQEEFYAPLERVFGVASPKERPLPVGVRKSKKTVGAPNPVKARTGRSPHIIRNPFETMIMNIPRVMRAAEINKAKLSMLALRDARPEALGPLMKLAPKSKKAQDPKFRANVEAVKIMMNLSGNDATSLTAAFDGESLNPNSNMIHIWRNGVMETWRIDPYLAAAYQSMHPTELSLFVDLMGMPNQLARKGIVNNPVFIARQAFRDNWQATLNSQYGFVPGVDWVRGWVHAMMRSPEYLTYVKGGGGHSSFAQRDVLNTKRALSALATHEGTAVGTAAKQTAQSLRRLINGDLGGSLESITSAWHTMIAPISEAARVGEYLRARGAGETVAEAVYAAKEVVGNFQSIAPAIRGLNHLALFVNPAIKALDQAFYASGIHPFRVPDSGRAAAATKYVLKGVATITIPSLMFYAASRDDKDIQDLRRTPGGNRFWFVRDPQGKIHKIAKPIYEGQLFGTSVENTLDAMKESDPQAWWDLLEAIRDDAAVNLIPTAAVIPASLYAGRDLHFGTPIGSSRTEDLESYSIVQRNSSLPARVISERLAPFTERVNSQAWRRVLSPAGLDYLARGFGGTLLEDALLGISQAVEYYESNYLPPTEEWPIIRGALVRFPTQGARSIREFYEDAERIDRRARQAKMLAETDLAAYEDYFNRHREDILQIEMYAAVRQELASMRQSLNEIEEAPRDIITPQEKHRLSQEIIMRMVETARLANATARATRYRPDQIQSR